MSEDERPSEETLGESVGDAASTLSRDVSRLVRAELDSAWGQLRDSVRRSALGVGLLAGAGTCSLVALAGSSATLLRLLETRMPKPAAAAVLTLLYGAGAAALGAAGAMSLRAARDEAIQAARSTAR